MLELTLLLGLALAVWYFLRSRTIPKSQEVTREDVNKEATLESDSRAIASNLSPPFKPGVPQPVPRPADLSIASHSPPLGTPEKEREYEEVAFIDFETTGLDPESDRIIEAGIIILKLGYSGEIEGSSRLANPGIPIPARITELTGITNEMMLDAKPSQEVIAEFLDKIGNRPVAAYNAKFDVAFLEHEARRIGRTFDNEWVCIMEYVKNKHPNLPRYRLTDVCGAFNVSAPAAAGAQIDAHRALYDVELTMRLFLAVSGGAMPSNVTQRVTVQTPIGSNLTRYHAIRESAKKLATLAKANEATDLSTAIHGYMSALGLLKDAAAIELYKRESQAGVEIIKSDKGDIDCLNRLTLCLCKLGRSAEAESVATEYFDTFPIDATLKSADQVRKRIAKAIGK